MTKIKLNRKELSEMVQRSIAKVLKEDSMGAASVNEDPSKRDMLSLLRSKYDRLGYDENSAEIAMYWFAYEYHGGQWSNLYSALSTSKYRPGRDVSSVSDEGDEMAEMMYDDLVSEYGGDVDDYDTEDDYSPERDSYNYDDSMEESVGDDEYADEDEYTDEFDGSDEDNMVDEDLVEYTIPTWAAAAMINADYSGLDDEDEEVVNKFSDKLVARHGNAYIMPGEEKGFQPFNDMTRLGDDVMTVYVRPNDIQESRAVKATNKNLLELSKKIAGSILNENKSRNNVQRVKLSELKKMILSTLKEEINRA